MGFRSIATGLGLAFLTSACMVTPDLYGRAPTRPLQGPVRTAEAGADDQALDLRGLEGIVEEACIATRHVRRETGANGTIITHLDLELNACNGRPAGKLEGLITDDHRGHRQLSVTFRGEDGSVHQINQQTSIN